MVLLLVMGASSRGHREAGSDGAILGWRKARAVKEVCQLVGDGPQPPLPHSDMPESLSDSCEQFCRSPLL